MQITVHWFWRGVYCLPLPSCLLSWSENRKGAWYSLRFLLALNKFVICWLVLGSFTEASSFPIFRGAAQRMLPISGKLCKQGSQHHLHLAHGGLKSGTSKHVSDSVSSSRKLTWIPFHLCLTSLACRLYSCARRAHAFGLVSLCSVCLPEFSASLGVIRHPCSSSEACAAPLGASVSTFSLLALPMTLKGSGTDSISCQNLPVMFSVAVLTFRNI